MSILFKNLCTKEDNKNADYILFLTEEYKLKKSLKSKVLEPFLNFFNEIIYAEFMFKLPIFKVCIMKYLK